MSALTYTIQQSQLDAGLKALLLHNNLNFNQWVAVSINGVSKGYLSDYAKSSGTPFYMVGAKECGLLRYSEPLIAGTSFSFVSNAQYTGTTFVSILGIYG